MVGHTEATKLTTSWTVFKQIKSMDVADACDLAVYARVCRVCHMRTSHPEPTVVVVALQLHSGSASNGLSLCSEPVPACSPSSTSYTLAPAPTLYASSIQVDGCPTVTWLERLVRATDDSQGARGQQPPYVRPQCMYTSSMYVHARQQPHQVAGA